MCRGTRRVVGIGCRCRDFVGNRSIVGRVDGPASVCRVSCGARDIGVVVFMSSCIIFAMSCSFMSASTSIPSSASPFTPDSSPTAPNNSLNPPLSDGIPLASASKAKLVSPVHNVTTADLAKYKQQLSTASSGRRVSDSPYVNRDANRSSLDSQCTLVPELALRVCSSIQVVAVEACRASSGLFFRPSSSAISDERL